MTRGYYFIELPSSLRQNIFLWLCASFAFSIPFKAIFNSILVLVLFLFWVVFLPKTFSRSSLKIVLVLSSLFWLGLLGMIWTQNSDEGWFRLQQKALLLMVPLIVLTTSPNRRWLQVAFSAFVMGVVVASVFGLGLAAYKWAVQSTTRYFFSHELAEGLDLYTYLFALLCVLSIIILTEAIRGNLPVHRQLTTRFAGPLLISFLSVMVFLLSVKQVIVIWMVCGVFYAMSLKGSATQKAFWAVLIMGAVSVVIVTNPALKQKVMELRATEENTIPLDQDASLGKSWNGIAIRKAIWTCAADVLQEHYLWGVGTGDVQDELQKAYADRKFYFASQYNRFNTHNQYLQSWIAHGVAGLLGILAMLFLPMYFYGVRSLFFIVSVCWMLCWLTESMLETNKGIVIFAVASSWIGCLYVDTNKTVS